MPKHVRLDKKQGACILLGFLFYGLSVFAGSGDIELREGQYLKRNSYGQGMADYELMVDGLAENQVPIIVQLRERAYSKEEASLVFEQAYEKLCQEILGDNPSLSQVKSDLKLITKMEEYGISIDWETEDYQLIDTSGQVNNENCRKEGEALYLKAFMKAGEEKAQFHIPLVIYPPDITQEMERVKGLKVLIDKMDSKDQYQEELSLPEQYEGRQLSYSLKEDSNHWILLFLGIGAAALLPLKERSDKEKEKKKREVQMLLDYSEILSKLVVFLGAGITIRKAWERVVKDYELSAKSDKGKQRHAYEEMCKTYYQMSTGISEAQAYYEFGNRCQLVAYRKLAALLEQNLKTGTKNLRNLLEIEMSGAFEQRKTLAKRLGEEAGTKLLVPLFLVLGVVMVMIVTPALMSFQL